ncbi:hypothetical protein BJ973_001185 [Actinoplanes tereljensis]|uniref:Uncharacterized protein n=1 Tax=Paractinoplanes tereljensis TaxID=571912 RepID=A0A919NMH7_9ACTN|nr:hypothetical protein [Actinoplanes tereljensis]GIF20908.1 hypothetical protein Ate02nite_36380 [Actinoplanes tereljensis]
MLGLFLAVIVFLFGDDILCRSGYSLSTCDKNEQAEAVGPGPTGPTSGPVKAGPTVSASAVPRSGPVKLLREYDVLIAMRKADPPQSNLDPLTGDIAREKDPYAVTFECRQQGHRNDGCTRGQAPAFWIDPIEGNGATGAVVDGDHVDDPAACHAGDGASREIHKGFTYCIKTGPWTAFFRIDDLPEMITSSDQQPEKVALKAHVKVWKN